MPRLSAVGISGLQAGEDVKNTSDGDAMKIRAVFSGGRAWVSVADLLTLDNRQLKSGNAMYIWYSKNIPECDRRRVRMATGITSGPGPRRKPQLAIASEAVPTFLAYIFRRNLIAGFNMEVPEYSRSPSSPF